MKVTPVSVPTTDGGKPHTDFRVHRPKGTGSTAAPTDDAGPAVEIRLSDAAQQANRHGRARGGGLGRHHGAGWRRAGAGTPNAAGSGPSAVGPAGKAGTTSAGGSAPSSAPSAVGPAGNTVTGGWSADWPLVTRFGISGTPDVVYTGTTNETPEQFAQRRAGIEARIAASFIPESELAPVSGPESASGLRVVDATGKAYAYGANTEYEMNKLQAFISANPNLNLSIVRG